MKDTGTLIYAPLWVRVTTLGLLATALAVSLYLAMTFISDPTASNQMLAALAIAQVALSGLSISVVLFFSQREIGVDALRKRTRGFLARELPAAFERLDHHPVFGAEPEFRARVRARVRSGALFGTFRIEAGSAMLTLRVSLNVKRLTVVAFVPLRDGGDVETALGQLKPVLDGARDAGYVVSATREGLDFDGDAPSLAIRLFNGAPSFDFLLNAKERLFWTQDLALMARALLIELHRNRSFG